MAKRVKKRMDEVGASRVRKNEEYRLMKRRRRVAEMYLGGKTQLEIAHEVGISKDTVGVDLKEIRRVWVEKMVEQFDMRKAEELAKLDRLEQVAWEAYEASRSTVTTTKRRNEAVRQVLPGPRKGGRSGNYKMMPLKEVEETQVRQRPEGDPRFLEQISWCIETRLRTMGLLKGETTNVNQVFIDWAGMLRSGATVAQLPNSQSQNVAGNLTQGSQEHEGVDELDISRVDGREVRGDVVESTSIAVENDAPTTRKLAHKPTNQPSHKPINESSNQPSKARSASSSSPEKPSGVGGSGKIDSIDEEEDEIEAKIREAEAQSHLKTKREGV